MKIKRRSDEATKRQRVECPNPPPFQGGAGRGESVQNPHNAHPSHQVSVKQPASISRLGTGALIALTLLTALTATAEPLEQTARKGPVEAAVQLEPIDPQIGDPVTLTLRVVAEKGVELLMPDFGQALERFLIYDFSTHEEIDAEGRTVVTQNYELQPPRSGQHHIPPIMVEFVDRRDGAKPAPDGLDAYELLTERLTFEVLSVLPDNAAAELNPPLDKLPPRLEKGGSRWPWIVFAIVVLVASPFVLRAWLASRRRARQRSAYEIAIGRLKKLLQQPRQEEKEVGAFFVELSTIVRMYLENRFELRAPELTTEEFLEAMSQSPDLSREHQGLLRDFLRQADLVKFANFHPTDQDINDSVNAARRFLEETRKDTPRNPPPAANSHPPARTRVQEIVRV